MQTIHWGFGERSDGWFSTHGYPRSTYGRGMAVYVMILLAIRHGSGAVELVALEWLQVDGDRQIPPTLAIVLWLLATGRITADDIERARDQHAESFANRQFP